jgi:hypothetical protein
VATDTCCVLLLDYCLFPHHHCCSPLFTAGCLLLSPGVQRVVVYPSNYGLERMAAEREAGPQVRR